MVDVLQRVDIHPAKDVLDLVPRVWKTQFSNNPLKSDLGIQSSDKGFLVLVEDGWDFLIECCKSNIMSNNKFKKLSVATHR
jgi:hypothetical protein